jgi:HlyD family secretion protein
MAKTNKRRKLVVFAIIVLALLTLGGFAILAKHEPVTTIEKEKVARRNITEIVEANGKIEPVTQIKISAEVSGEILELPFKEGQDVKKGDLLVVIRPDNYVATSNSSYANFRYSLANSNNAAANLEKAELDYIRNEALYTNKEVKIIAETDLLGFKTAFDSAKATLDGAIEQVGMAYASLQSSIADLNKTRIYSPISGRITKLGCQKGERVVGTAMMTGTEIMTVSDLTEMEARVDIGEMDMPLIAAGEHAKLEVDAFKDKKFQGIVTDTANSANNNDTSSTAASSTSTEATKFQVKIRVQDKESFLPGMSVTARIETRSRTNVWTVPIQCVTTRMPGVPKESQTTGKDAASPDLPPVKNGSGEGPKAIEVVFVVTNDHAKMVPIKRGISDDNYVEISDGLKGSEEVVTGSFKAINRELEDGRKVALNTQNSGANAAGGGKTE